MVPTSSMIMMAVNAVLGLAVPVCLSIYLVRRHHAKLTTILIGAGTFFLFAFMCFPYLWIMYRHVPNTTGKTLEEIEEYWSRIGRGAK